MTISILLRTQNAESDLEKFTELAGEGWELVVIDHLSSDCTVETARRMNAKVLEYPSKAFSYGKALNLGVAACTGDWVLVASPHFEPLVENFWERLRQDLAALAEDVLVCQMPGYLERKHVPPPIGLTFLDENDLPVIPWKVYGNSCCAYRRGALQSFPFDEFLPTGEDLEWCLRIVRAGFRVTIDHRLPILYRNRAPLSRYWRRGRTDLPTEARIYGVEFRPSWRRTTIALVRDFASFVRACYPWWFWLRLVVKRLAEYSLCVRPKTSAREKR